MNHQKTAKVCQQCRYIFFNLLQVLAFQKLCTCISGVLCISITIERFCVVMDTTSENSTLEMCYISKASQGK